MTDRPPRAPRPPWRPSDELPPDIPESVRKLIKAEYTGLPYGAILKSLAALTGRVELQTAESALEQVVRQGRSVFTTNISGDEHNALFLSGVFARMRTQYTSELATLDKAIGEGDAVKSPSAQLQSNLATLKSVREKMPGQRDEAEQAVRDQLVELAQSYGQAVAANLADLPPFAASELQRMVAAGTTSLGKDVAAVLPGPPFRWRTWRAISAPAGSPSSGNSSCCSSSPALTSPPSSSRATSGACVWECRPRKSAAHSPAARMPSAWPVTCLGTSARRRCRRKGP